MTTATEPVATPPVTATTPAPAATTATPGATSTPPVAATATEYKFDPIEGVSADFDKDVSTVAKEMGWDQATAAKFRAYEAKQALEAAAADKKSSTEAQAAAKAKHEQEIAQRNQAWEKANREHKEFGGAKYDETTERMKQFLVRFDPDKTFAAELEKAPELLNAPAFRSLIARAAYAMGDAKFHEGSATPPKTSDADLFYGKAKA